jgi:hypothetical protein
LTHVLIEMTRLLNTPIIGDGRCATLLKDRHAGWAVAWEGRRLAFAHRHVGCHHAKQQRRNPDAPRRLLIDPSG